VAKPKKKLTPQEKQQRAHRRAVRAAFRYAGFDRVNELAEKIFTYEKQKAEFDDAFLHENVIILVEYTVHAPEHIKGHLKKKKIIFDLITNDPQPFFKFLREKYAKFDERIKANGEFPASRLILKIVYCSMQDFESNAKTHFGDIVFFDFPVVKYFEKITRTIRLSARPELLSFIGIDPNKVRHDGGFLPSGSSDPYRGSVLPEEASGLPEGYKVVSFYADPASLLKRCFVLRRSGWRASTEAYQRMLLPSKIESLRRMVFKEKRVAINNLIVTLPSTVHPVEEESGKTIDVKKLTQTEPVKIQLPADPNTMGVIDGQHRLFAYYVSAKDTPEQDSLRKMQNLLVTGIIYPSDTDELERERFEASLFLSINSNQTSASSELTQEIKVLVDRFDQISIAKQVMAKLADTKPLFGHVERYFYEKGKLKTSSIVSYGLSPLVKLSGDDSLFSVFAHDHKDKLPQKKAANALNDYIDFCARTISHFLLAVKQDVGDSRWTTDRKVGNRILTVTYVNAFLITMRKIIEDGGSLGPIDLKKSLSGISKFDFKKFHSSQYNRMAEEIYKKHFGQHT
jgi:DGQHR domain-containing protein